jgi:RES domain-containing protein
MVGTLVTGFDIDNVRQIEGDWRAFRQAGVGYPPLWLPPLKDHSKPQPSGRWHVEGESYAQYMAVDDEDASWAELVRFEGVRTEEHRRHLEFRLWRLTVVEDGIAELDTFDRIAEAGVEPHAFVDDDHSYCQELARELCAANFRGVLAPSAAYPGATNLTLFGPRRECRLEERNRQPRHWVPCRLVADLAVPPVHVMERTRYFGEPHLTLAEWEPRAGRARGSEGGERVA